MPYVTAILNKSVVSGEFFNFILGKHAFNELSRVANSSTFSKFLDPFFLILGHLTGKWKKLVEVCSAYKIN